MKIIPLYLPQFHQISENDEWWGEGFTEWTNVRKSRPLFKNHYQPREPLNDNYYDLTDKETLRWQCQIAKDHGIYGFCFYHYWFNGKLLLEKPMEILLENKDIEINYCISWANHNWENSWKASPGNEEILIGHDFDDESDWAAHFDYLLKFFKDERYIKEENKPLLIIYIPNIIPKLNKMLNTWTEMAVDAGYDGIKFIFQSAMSFHSQGWDRSGFDHGIEFQPGFVSLQKNRFTKYNLMLHANRIKKKLGIKKRISRKQTKVVTHNYDEAWEKILALKPSSSTSIPSAFVDWDNTPRKLYAGSVYVGASPEKFEGYFTRLLAKAKYEYQTDKVFLFAWNEWAEGGYLEPDKRFGYGYLEAIRNALKNHGDSHYK
jgi:hypothetical protein